MRGHTLSDTVHDDSHLVMLPRENERESFTRLDTLLGALLDVRLAPTPSAVLIGEHLSHLTANLQKVPSIGQRPILDISYPHAIRWMQLTLGAEIDRWLIRFLTTDNCRECRCIWALHLVEARDLLNDWALTCEFRFRHGLAQ